MKIKYLNILAAIAIAGSGMLTSCSLDLENPDGPSASGFYNEQDKFILSIIGIHQEWRSDFDVNVLRNAGELRAGIYNISGIDGSALNDLTYINNSLDAAHPQFNNFAGFYGVIANLNSFIYYAEQNSGVFLSEAAHDYLLGMAKGMRAYCYFQLHKMYGTCPLRIEPDVMLGNFNALDLAMPRSDAETVLKFVKDEVASSLQLFESGASFSDSRITGSKNYWNKAASEMLAGEVYLWSAKVSTDNHTANPADITTAKTHFENVVNKYGLGMMPTYDDVFATKAGNTEVIFATYYGWGIQTANWYHAYFWAYSTGQAKGNFWSCFGEDGLTPIKDANRTGYYINSEGQPVYNNMYYHGFGNVVNRYQYRNAIWYQFDATDSRRGMLLDNYLVEEDEKDLNFIENFDKDAHRLAGVFVNKYKGEVIDDWTRGINNMIYYRLPLAYMYLAEIANYNDVPSDVEMYINLVRQRAYGENWDEATYGYKAGDFRANEVAILKEKTKEFLMEGQRWWDLRRLTSVKGGEAKDHLIFLPESNPGWGLDVASHPLWNEVCSSLSNLSNCVLDTQTPVLDYETQGHMVLWPVNTALLSKSIKQTPGYEEKEEK